MYLIDTNVISEARKGRNADPGVRQFFQKIVASDTPVFLSVITVGELRRGVERIRHRGDNTQAAHLNSWLTHLVEEYGDYILSIDRDIAQLWGCLRAPSHENALDKMIAATALIHALTVVTRNVKDFRSTGVELLNPFEQ